jgi:plasmid stability protein
MATLVIRDVEPELHTRLKAQAAAHGRSMEEEVRSVLRQSIAASSSDLSPKFGQAMRALFEPLGGFELEEANRETPRDPPDFIGPEWDQPV